MISTSKVTSAGLAVGLGLAAAAALLVGCVDGEPSHTGAASQMLAGMPNPRTEVPRVCPQRAYCVFKPAEGSDANTSQYPLWSSLGCGAIYDFQTGPSFGLGALCTDSTKNRGLLHAHAMSGFTPSDCEPIPPGDFPCLGMPPGLLFVEFAAKDPDPSPFCPSTCAGMLSPQLF